MGKCCSCCSCFSRFRAVFKPETVTDSPLKPVCTKPECLPRPPSTPEPGKSQSDEFHPRWNCTLHTFRESLLLKLCVIYIGATNYLRRDA